MRRWQWRGTMILGGAIALALWLCGASWAQQPRLEYPLPGPCSCVPNVLHWGYFETCWRRWPGEVSLSEINPLAPGREVLTTPEGRRIVPPPKAAMPGQPSPQPQQPQGPQPQQQPPAHEESILPPGGPSVVPMPGTQSPSAPGGPGSIPSPAKPEGGLPDLPELEPGKPSNSVPPAVPPATPSTTPPAVPPANPPTADTPKRFEGSPRNSIWDTGPKLGNSTDMTTAYPTRPANVAAARRWERPRSDQPLAPIAATRTDAAVASACTAQSERNAVQPSAPRADSIAVSAEPAAAVEPAAYAFAASAPKPADVDRTALPAVALGGYCPVELSEKGCWVLGDLRWTVVHRGWIYRLAGPEQRRQFLADPDRFAPVNGGNDAVLSLSQHSNVPGKTAYCAVYDNRLYMFCNAATRDEFNRNPERYAARK